KDISDTKPAEIIYKSSIENPSINPSENSEKIMEKLTLNRGAEMERGHSPTLVNTHQRLRTCRWPTYDFFRLP
ncbi:MAG: hypothetical protein NTX02_13325, partial [Planctomycetia bacterium]|nr:hypothetical protein [Planctomycetia bacterium]